MQKLLRHILLFTAFFLQLSVSFSIQNVAQGASTDQRLFVYLHKWIDQSFDEASDVEKLSALESAFESSDLSVDQLNQLNSAINKNGGIHDEFGELLVKISEGNNIQLLAQISGPDWSTSLGKLTDDLADGTEQFRGVLYGEPEGAEAWKVVSHKSQPLRTNPEVLEAVSKIRNNPKFADVGLTDESLGQIKGWGYADDGASYAEIVTDLDRLLTNCHNNSINIANFEKITNVLKGNNNANIKGMHWIVQDLADDVTTFNSKTIQLEFPVQNARPTNGSSYIDVYCVNCYDDTKVLLVEYKYGPTSVTKDKIIEQFIERDLFNPDITSINQIQWRLKETALTKSQLNTWLKTTECRTAIENLGFEKINQLFGKNFNEFTQSSELSQSVIDYLNIENNFTTIFKLQ